jgi:intracellular multiplication protein IcmG
MKEDYFDADLEPEASLLPTDNTGSTEDIDGPASTSNTPKTRQFSGYDLNTLLIAGAVVVALAVYAVWPDSPPPRVFIPDDADQQFVRHQPEPATPLSEPECVASQSPAPAAIDNEEIRQFSAASREAITALSDRMGNVERRLNDIEALLRTLASKPAVQSQATKPSVTASRTKQTARTTTARANTTGVKGWRVHTVYPGMAWITHNGSTWAVQAGDFLRGMTIRSIDTERRVVVTDKGVIRQEG